MADIKATYIYETIKKWQKTTEKFRGF
jgi:hypothetical protein